VPFGLVTTLRIPSHRVEEARTNSKLDFSPNGMEAVFRHGVVLCQY